MFQIFRKYKSVLRFILTFLGSYLLLSFFYSLYLEHSDSKTYYPDYITHQVAVQTEWVIESLGYDSSIEPHDKEASMKLSVEGEYLARVIEGCNAVSVMILFVSFVLAFYNGIKKTLLFIVSGVIAIYVMNIVRIALLAIALYTYPQYDDILHGVIFPAVIYGFVFLLWLYWVNRFTVKKSA